MNKSGFQQKLFMFKPLVFIIFLLLGFIVLSVLSSTKVMAQGNLLITPTRVVFEGSKKSQEINLANTGRDTTTYRISIVQRRMKKDGGFEEITQPDSGQYFADKNIRFFPRNVTLPPGEAQSVKIQVTKTNLLSQGEYRSHLFFRAVPEKKPLGEKNKTPADSTSIRIHLSAVFGITIPVIIRIGENTAKVSISDLTFEMINDTTPMLKMTFFRTGNMSVYGDIVVNYISSKGKITQAGIAKGVAVYTPNSVRQSRLNLKNKAGIDYHTGNLQVIYSTRSGDKLAEAEILLH